MPKVMDIPVLMSLKSKQIIRSWHDWPFSLFPYKEADVGIIAGFAKTAGFFSGQWYLCCSHGDIMQISESSGGCVPSSRVSVDPSPTVPCRVSPVIHEVPFQRGPRLPGHCFSRWVARAARVSRASPLWAPGCFDEAASLGPVGQPFSTWKMVHYILLFPTGFSFCRGKTLWFTQKWRQFSEFLKCASCGL